MDLGAIALGFIVIVCGIIAVRKREHRKVTAFFGGLALLSALLITRSYSASSFNNSVSAQKTLQRLQQHDHAQVNKWVAHNHLKVTSIRSDGNNIWEVTLQPSHHCKSALMVSNQYSPQGTYIATNVVNRPECLNWLGLGSTTTAALRR